MFRKITTQEITKVLRHVRISSGASGNGGISDCIGIGGWGDDVGVLWKAAGNVDVSLNGFRRLQRSRTATSAILGRAVEERIESEGTSGEIIHEAKFVGSQGDEKHVTKGKGQGMELGSSGSTDVKVVAENDYHQHEQPKEENRYGIEEKAYDIHNGTIKSGKNENPVDFRLAEESVVLSSVETELILPDDMDVIGKLNPSLREAMERHAEMERRSTVGIQEHLSDLIRQSHGKSANITKTALNRLRVDQLRAALDFINADTRGNKPALIKRLLNAVDSEKVQGEATEKIRMTLKPGKFARLDINNIKRDGIHKPINQEELLREQRLITTAEPTFSKVFKTPHELAMVMQSAHADDITIIDVKGRCAFTDYMLIASTRSHQMARRLAGAVLHEIKSRCKEVAPGIAPTIEGNDDSNPEWLVVDAGSILVHIFQEDARKEYDLEGLWGDGNNIARVARPQRAMTLDNLTISH